MPFDLQWEVDAVGALGLYRIQSASGVRMLIESSFDGYYLGLIDAGRASVHVGGQPVLHSSGEGFVLDARRAVTTVLWGGGTARVLAICADCMHGALQSLLGSPVRSRLRFAASSIGRNTGLLRLLSALELLMWSGSHGTPPVHHAPRAMDSLRDSLVHFLLSQLNHNYTEALGGRVGIAMSQSIERAVEFMRASSTDTLAVSDIARAAGVSVRSLQAGFRRYHATTPKGFLRSIRLQSVRCELLKAQAGTSVARAARRWGFAHLGTFASHYRRVFGELPSSTLRRSHRSRALQHPHAAMQREIPPAQLPLSWTECDLIEG